MCVGGSIIMEKQKSNFLFLEAACSVAIDIGAPNKNTEVDL